MTKVEPELDEQAKAMLRRIEHAVALIMSSVAANDLDPEITALAMANLGWWMAERAKVETKRYRQVLLASRSAFHYYDDAIGRGAVAGEQIRRQAIEHALSQLPHDGQAN